MASRIFISYSKADREPAQELAAFLTGQGYTVWWDPNLTSGEVFRDVIDRELDAADAAIVIWTANSVASNWVIAEADHAARLDKLITVRTKDFEPWRIPKPFNTYQADRYDDYASVLAAVQRVTQKPISPAFNQSRATTLKNTSKTVLFRAFWLAIVILGAGAMMALSFVKLPQTSIEIEANSRTLALKVADEEVTLDPFLAASIQVRGPGKVDLEGETKPFQSVYSISTIGSVAPFTVQGLKLRRGDVFRLGKKTGTVKTFDVTIPSTAESSLTVLARGSLLIDADGKRAPIQSPTPQSFEFSFPGEARFSLNLAEKEWIEGKSFAVDKVSFLDVSERDGVPISLSGLSRGRIRFGDIEAMKGNDKEILLESGQHVGVTPKSPGEVGILKLSDAGIDVTYRGEVIELLTGKDESSMANQMPSYMMSYNWLGLTLSVSAIMAALILVYSRLLSGRTAKS